MAPAPEIINADQVSYDNTEVSPPLPPGTPDITGQQALDALKTQGAGLDARTTSLESRTTAVEGRCTALEAHDVILDGQVATLASRDTALEARTTVLEGETATLDGRCDALEGEVASIDEVLVPARHKFDVLSAMRASGMPIPGKFAFDLTGYHEKGDGGGGPVQWVEDSEDPQDGLTTFAVDGVIVGRTKRARYTRYDGKAAGAIGDGQHHPVGSTPAYSGMSLAQVQAIYPSCVSLDDEMDQLALERVALTQGQLWPNVPGSLNQQGGVIEVSGIYRLNRRWNLQGAFSLRIAGVGCKGTAGSVSKGSGATLLLDSAEDILLDARSTFSVQFLHCTIWYTNPAFKGRVVCGDHRPGESTGDTTGLIVHDCAISGDPRVFTEAGKGAEALVSLDQAIGCVVDFNHFGLARAAIRGREYRYGRPSYSNGCQITRNMFTYCRDYIVNPGQWTISDNTIEALGGATEHFITEDCQFTLAHPECVWTWNAAAKTLHRSSGRWDDHGFAVDMHPSVVDPDGANGGNYSAIIGIVDDGATLVFATASFVDQTSTTARMWADGPLETSGTGASARASAGLVITLHGDSMTSTVPWTSSEGGNWEVGFSGSLVGQLHNASGVPPITAISEDGLVLTCAGAGFTDEILTDALFHYPIAGGNWTCDNNNTNDNFLPDTTWIELKQPQIGIGMDGNTFVGTARVLTLHCGAVDLEVTRSNRFISVQKPILHGKFTPGASGIDYKAGGTDQVFPWEGPLPNFDYEIVPSSSHGVGAVDFGPASYRIHTDKYEQLALNDTNFDEYFTYPWALNLAGGEADLRLGGRRAPRDPVTHEVTGPAQVFMQSFGSWLRIQLLGELSLGRDSSKVGTSLTRRPLSAHDVGGAVATPARVATASGTVQFEDSHVEVDASSGDNTQTLLDPWTCPGREHTFARVDGSANAATITANEVRSTLGTATSYPLPSEGSFARVKAIKTGDVSGYWRVL